MRRIFILLGLTLLLHQVECAAQLVDNIIGLKRTKVQQLLRPYHILDYQKDRVDYSFAKGIRQTVVYTNDTCTGFFWAVSSDQLKGFIGSLQKAGYVMDKDSSFSKAGLWVVSQRLESGRATLFTAMQDKAAAIATNSAAVARTSASDLSFTKRKGPVMVELPLMQQEVLAEKNDTTKKVKDPTRNWVGGEAKSVSVLGWVK